jgi:hypothetical protein
LVQYPVKKGGMTARFCGTSAYIMLTLTGLNTDVTAVFISLEELRVRTYVSLIVSIIMRMRGSGSRNTTIFAVLLDVSTTCFGH